MHTLHIIRCCLFVAPCFANFSLSFCWLFDYFKDNELKKWNGFKDWLLHDNIAMITPSLEYWTNHISTHFVKKVNAAGKLFSGISTINFCKIGTSIRRKRNHPRPSALSSQVFWIFSFSPEMFDTASPLSYALLQKWMVTISANVDIFQTDTSFIS